MFRVLLPAFFVFFLTRASQNFEISLSTVDEKEFYKFERAPKKEATATDFYNIQRNYSDKSFLFYVYSFDDSNEQKEAKELYHKKFRSLSDLEGDEKFVVFHTEYGDGSGHLKANVKSEEFSLTVTWEKSITQGVISSNNYTFPSVILESVLEDATKLKIEIIEPLSCVEFQIDNRKRFFCIIATIEP